MKGPGILTALLIISASALAQVDLGAIMNLMDQPQKKIENYLHKKGFQRESYFSTHGLLYTSQETEDSVPVNRSFQFIFNEDAYQLVYKTSSWKEHATWKKELQSMTPFNRRENTGIYFDPKHSLTLQCAEEKMDTATSFTLSATRKILPRARDLIYAEDLLEIDAHVYLEVIFGRQNVKEDYFYFSETLKKKCSVIYPNTSRQAIYLWNDEVSLKDVSFIIIGEYESKSNHNLQSPLTLAQWRSRQGISCGMNLKELEMINQKEINFYRWRSPNSGTLSSNKGEIDFSGIEIVLDCMNCSFTSTEGGAMVISSVEASDQKQKWYVRSFAVVKSRSSQDPNE